MSTRDKQEPCRMTIAKYRVEYSQATSKKTQKQTPTYTAATKAMLLVSQGLK
ncbi:hypothetical protein BG011_007736, partial [Mortierella polycephala]